MGAVFERLRASISRHRVAARRTGVAVVALAAGLLVAGGTIRMLQAADREPAPLEPSGTPTVAWRADVPGPVTGIATDGDLLYVAGDQLDVFPLDCVVEGETCRARWRGVVPDGPLSAPTVGDDHVFAGSVDGQLYAFPADCDAEGCPPAWVGLAGRGPVSRPAANFDLVYATSDELYAFPVGCATDDQGCRPAWTADVPGRPADGPPALGGGLVLVASSSTRGGVAAYPAVCDDPCAPAWTGRTDGPATSVAFGDGLAYTVARGALLAFDVTCEARCDPVWRAPFRSGAPFATGAVAAPTVSGDRVFVGADDGSLWIFRAGCDEARCDPLAEVRIADTPLHTPVVDEDRVLVTSADGVVARVLPGCELPAACDPVLTLELGADAVAPAAFAPYATAAGDAEGRVRTFRWATLPR